MAAQWRKINHRRWPYNQYCRDHSRAHKLAKNDAGYYLRMDSTRATLQFKLQAFWKGKETVSTRLTREGGEKTIVDVENLQHQEKAVLEEGDKNQWMIADQSSTIQVANLTIEEIRRQNSDLLTEVRRAGRRFLELGN